jgi:hypothetical protein
MNKEVIFFLLYFLLIQTASTAQDFVSEKSQVIVALKTEQCDIKAESQALEVAADVASGHFIFRIMVASFQSKAAPGNTKDCWSSDKFRRISFRGRLDNYEILQSNKDGFYPITLIGEITALGQVFPISESLAVQVEKGKINMSFNTTLNGSNWSMDFDLTTTLGVAVINE